MVLVVDQSAGPLMVDIVNSIIASGMKVSLFNGAVRSGNKEIHSDVRIIRRRRYERATLFSRVFTWSIFSIQYFFYLIRCEKPAVILTTTNPPLLTFITAIVASWRNIPFCLLIYDLYPEALKHAELGTHESLLFRVWQRLNKTYFSRAEVVFTISNTMKKEIAKYCPHERIVVIHNWADTEYVRPMEKQDNRLANELGLANKKVVLYAGNCGLTHDLESLIEAAHLLRQNGNIMFIIAGEGGKRQKLEKIANSLALQNILFLPYQSEKDFPLLMAAADIGVVTLGIGSEAISVPSKTYTNLAAGLCLLAISHPTSELGEIISRYQVGELCPPQNPRALADVIRKILQDDDLLTKYKRNSRTAVSNFTRRNADLYSERLKVFG